MDFDNSENTTDSSLSIMEYVSIVWHWAWLIILIIIVVAGATYIINSRQTPIFESTTQLLVSDPPGTQNVTSSTIVTTSNSTSTYSAMLTDTPVLENVIADLKLSLSPPILREAITVSIVPNTQIISVSVMDPDPALARKIADTIGIEFQKRIQGIQQARYSASEKSRQDLIDKLNSDLLAATDSAQISKLNDQIASAQTSLDQVVLAEAQSSTNVIQIEPASTPDTPISPRTLANTLLAVVIAGMLSVGGILAVDFLDDSIKNPEEITTKFGIPVLGIISRHMIEDGKPITVGQPRSPISESFRALRTNIQYASVTHQIRTLIITSPTPQDGKTTISVNLSVVLAQSGKKVILIDGDMRRPQIDKRLKLPNRSGLSGLFLRPLEDLEGTVEKTGTEGLSVITSGQIPPNPSELLSSQKMAQILEKINETCDIVVIDTPPVLSVTDSVALSTMVDGVLLVAKPGQTKLATFKQSVEQIRRVGGNILGVVLNGIEPRSARYGYYYRQYYTKAAYYYDQETGEKKKKKKTEVTAGVKEG
jgi:non-specific protein-tyrosine kinase